MVQEAEALAVQALRRAGQLLVLAVAVLPVRAVQERTQAGQVVEVAVAQTPQVALVQMQWVLLVAVVAAEVVLLCRRQVALVQMHPGQQVVAAVVVRVQLIQPVMRAVQERTRVVQRVVPVAVVPVVRLQQPEALVQMHPGQQAVAVAVARVVPEETEAPLAVRVSPAQPEVVQPVVLAVEEAAVDLVVVAMVLREAHKQAAAVGAVRAQVEEERAQPLSVLQVDQAAAADH